MSIVAVNYPAERWAPAEETPAAEEAENILLVDDLSGNLLVYKTILEDLGQNLVTARSGEDALKMVLKQEFAVILLDVNMPTMDGFETASLIRKRKKSAQTPIIFLTAFTDEVGMAQSYASGAVDYLPTPIIPEVLKAKVRVFIELSRMRRQAALQTEERVRREAAEESARKSAFLVKAGESLARTQTHAELLRELVRLPVPHMADIGVACITDEEGNAAQMECSIVPDPVIGGDLPSLLLAELPWLKRAARHVLATGQARLLDKTPPLPASHANLLPALGSMLILPLAAQGRTRGVFILARQKSSEPYRVADMPLANDLASRAGVVLENVMLMERIRESDRRKDEFLGMLAHELRNPLGPIYNAIQLQKMIPPDDARMGDLREIIDRQAKHMGRLIDDLLDATRLAHGKILLRKERCDLDRLVRQTAEDYRAIIESNDLQFDVTTPGTPLWINGDPTRIVQAIGNLLHNAHKFTMAGGRISIELAINKSKRGATVTVTDTGIGIEPKMLSYIFDVFRQAEQGLDRSRGGLGLGLALVKGLVELHNGRVHAASDGIDKGARFSLELPLEKLQTEDGTALPAAVAGADKFRMLIIEDNEDAAESAQMLLRMEGHDVKTAYTALAGLDTARSFNPQVILCDIGLPGMDGYQVVRAIRQDDKLASIYMIALTGYGREQDQRRASEAGFDVHLTKPIDYLNLQQALAQAGKKCAEREALAS